MAHIRYEGSLKFDICTKLNSTDLETNLNTILDDLNKRNDFDGDLWDIKFNKIRLCEDDCLDDEQEQDEDL